MTEPFNCDVCGGAVSKQMGQHKHLRVRRADGSGWDHARCVAEPNLPFFLDGLGSSVQ